MGQRIPEKEIANFQFIGQINLYMKEIQPADSGWLFYSLYSNTAFIMANASSCLLGEVSFQIFYFPDSTDFVFFDSSCQKIISEIFRKPCKCL